MYHRDLYLEQGTKYGYQNRSNNGDPLATCILLLASGGKAGSGHLVSCPGQS